VIIAVLALWGAVADCPPERKCVSFGAELQRGERLSRELTRGLTFVLEPMEFGWEIVVRDDRPRENIARLTPPFHFVPNPRYVEGWHFRKADNTGPNDGSVNAPQEERDFVFSVEVGRSIQGPLAQYSTTAAEVEAVRQWGQGQLHIKSYELDSPRRGQRASIQRMVFDVRVSWPASWVAPSRD
jgi:hypothetical protein